MIIQGIGTFVDIERNSSLVDIAMSVICIIVTGNMYFIFLLNISSRHVSLVFFMMFVIRTAFFLMNLFFRVFAFLDECSIIFCGIET